MARQLLAALLYTAIITAPHCVCCYVGLAFGMGREMMESVPQS
jgi:hypothetical protein